MDDKKKSILQQFLDSIAELYSQIDNWLGSTSLRATRQKVEIVEEACGAYKVQKLTISDPGGTTIADIVPIGAWIIGAKGRVDLIGRRDKVILVNLEKGGPAMTTTINCGAYEETSATKFYTGVEEAGWYWIEDRRLGKARKIDKELFYGLLAEVSDYESK